jgi:hypothetical protein
VPSIVHGIVARHENLLNVAKVSTEKKNRAADAGCQPEPIFSERPSDHLILYIFYKFVTTGSFIAKL